MRKSVPQDVKAGPKADALWGGSLHLEYRRCGKPNCRCAGGRPHGPYFAFRWRECGRQRKALVRPEDVSKVLAGIEERRGLGSVSHIKESLRHARR